MISQRYNEELKIKEDVEKQHEKYEIIKNNSALSINKQKGLLTDIQMYHEVSSIRHEGDIQLKKKKFNELEFQVFTIKSDTVEIQNKLQNIKSNTKDVLTKIKEAKLKNSLIIQKNKKKSREYLQNKIKLLKIYNSLKVKSLEDIINNFNILKIEYISLYTQFTELNKVIVDLNLEQTELSKHLKQVEEGVKLKKENEEKYDNGSYENTMEIKLREIRNRNVTLREKLLTNENTIVLIKKYLIKYDSKISEILNSLFFSLNMDYKIHTERLALNLEFENINVSPKDSFELQQLNELNELNESQQFNELKELDMKKLPSNQFVKLESLKTNTNIELTREIINKLVKLFINFLSKFFYVVSLLCLDITLNIKNDPGLNKPALPKVRKSSVNKTRVEVYYIHSSETLNKFEELVFQAMFRLENKIKILSRTEKEIFKSFKHQVDTPKKEETTNRHTSMENIYNKFTGYLSRQGEDQKLTFVKTVQSQIRVQMNKFTNDLVTSKREIATDRSKSNEITKKVSKNNFNRASLLAKPKPTFKNNYERDNQVNDLENSYISDYKSPVDSKEKEEVIIEKKRIKMHQRLDDIRNLELSIYREGSRSIVNEKFNELYYNFKKKYNLKNQNSFLSGDNFYDKKVSKIYLEKNIHNKNSSVSSTRELVSRVSSVKEKTKTHFRAASTNGFNSTAVSLLIPPIENGKKKEKLKNFEIKISANKMKNLLSLNNSSISKTQTQIHRFNKDKHDKQK